MTIYRLRLLAIFLLVAAMPAAALANPGYGPKCYDCHTSGAAGSSNDLNGKGAKFARDGHKFPEEEKKEEEKKEGEEGTGEAGASGEGSGTTTSAGEGGSGEGGGSGGSSGEGSSGGGSPDGATTDGSSSGGGDYSGGSSSTPVDNSPAIEGPASIVSTGEAVAQASETPPASAEPAPAPAANDPLSKSAATGKKGFNIVSPKLSSAGKSCVSCHEGSALAGKWGEYPKFRSELSKVVTVEQAICWCLENNMKGPTLTPDHQLVVALSVYLKNLTK